MSWLVAHGKVRHCFVCKSESTELLSHSIKCSSSCGSQAKTISKAAAQRLSPKLNFQKPVSPAVFPACTGWVGG